MQAQQARRFQTQNGPTPDDKGWGTSYNLSNCPLWLKNEPDAVAVYVVAPENGHPCKIGHSRNCEKRRDSIQTPHWIELFVHGVIWLPTKKQAARVEREVHRFLNKRNKLLRGEWYDIRNSEAYRVVEGRLYT